MRLRGFTLPELVVVILVIGILAVASASKLFSNADAARDAATRQSLLVVREAIERYRIENDGQLPGLSDGLAGDLADHLRGPFPAAHVGPRNAAVAYTADTDPTGEANPAASWKYSITSGDFVVNLNTATAVDPSVTYDEW